MTDEKTRRIILGFQKNEITEHFVYKSLAQKMRGENAEVLRRISKDELRHYEELKSYTQIDVPPSKLNVLRFLIISSIFGLTFAIKIMERGEQKAQKVYAEISESVSGSERILNDEIEHEEALINMIDEERIGYIGSMFLGLNDALVELTGALAGLTFTLHNAKLIGAAGLVTGIAASLSMSASEYLSQKSEKGSKNPVKASFYTGTVYMLAVLLLITPYFAFSEHYIALGVTILDSVLVILFFTFFVSVVKELSFRKIFLEMLFISLGVASVSFLIGWIANRVLNVQV